MPGCGGSGCGCGGNCASSIPGFYLRGSLGGGGGGTGFVCVFSIRRPNGACASCHRRGRKGELVISHICVYGVSKTQNRRFTSITINKHSENNGQEGRVPHFLAWELANPIPSAQRRNKFTQWSPTDGGQNKTGSL